jgi:hypothetical protein
MKKVVAVIGAGILALALYTAHRLVPRHVSLTVHGIQFAANRPFLPTKHVTLQLNGTVRGSLWGKRVFQGTVSVHGATEPNRDNTRSVAVVFNPSMGGEILYWSWKTQTYYDYGEMFANPGFNNFAVLEYRSAQHGWTENGGLVIAAPAQTRSQAVALANHLAQSQWGHIHLK